MSLYLKATMKNGDLVIKNHDQVRHILQQLDGKELIVHIEPFKEKASNKQKRWYFGVAVNRIIQGHKKQSGETLTKEEVHAYNISVIVKPRLRTKEIMGKTIIEISDFSLSDMTKTDFQDFKIKLQEFWAQKDIDIPDPGEEDFVNEKKENGYESIRRTEYKNP